MFVHWLPSDATFVSWSESDEDQIRKGLEGKSIIVEGLECYLDSWIDCQETFSERMNSQKVYRLSEALAIADINYDEGAHDALVDAKNTAQLFIKMQREPELVLNPHYSNQSQRSTYCPFAELFEKYGLAC
jgi:inhibitor of KinA sporulation pathway (predicted exonuclease)